MVGIAAKLYSVAHIIDRTREETDEMTKLSATLKNYAAPLTLS